MAQSAVQRFAGLTKVLVAFVVAALVLAAAVAFINRGGKNTFTADFTVANSLYKGSLVKVIGVPVGTVKKIEPKGDVVRVTIEVKDDVKIPKDAKALIISPAIVGDRFVQIAPAFTGGATMADGDHFDSEHTQVPIELDDAFKAFDDLSVALGPEGANKDGSLSRLIEGSASALKGQGEQLNQTIQNFSKLSSTLSGNREELFSSVREVSGFVSMLRRNDAVVRDFNSNTAALASLLADERGDLAATIKALAAALIDVRGLLDENRSSLRTNIDNLVGVTETLGNRRAELNDAWKSAPTALVNVALAYNGRFGSLDARTNILDGLLGGFGGLGEVLTGLLGAGGAGELLEILNGLGIPGLPDLPIPLGRADAQNVQQDQSVAEMLGAE